jgi:hypothetical protein
VLLLLLSAATAGCSRHSTACSRPQSCCVCYCTAPALLLLLPLDAGSNSEGQHAANVPRKRIT